MFSKLAREKRKGLHEYIIFIQAFIKTNFAEKTVTKAAFSFNFYLLIGCMYLSISAYLMYRFTFYDVFFIYIEIARVQPKAEDVNVLADI